MKKKEDISDLYFKSFSKIEDINQNEWDSIIPSSHILNSYSYLKAIEESNINNFRYNYFIFYYDKKIIAHISVGILCYELDLMTGKVVKEISRHIRKIIPNFLKMTVIECGHSTALGNTFEIIDSKYTPEIIKIFDRELINLARKEKTSVIALRDFYPADRKKFDLLYKYNYKPYLNLPNTFIKTKYSDFEDYLLDLAAKMRQEIKRRLRAFYNNGCTVEKITDFSDISAKLLELWSNTYKHAKEYQREILNENYFKYISENLKENSFVLLCKNQDKDIGFTMCIDSGDTLISTYCGLDYDYNKKYYTYFILTYKLIEEAINTKKEFLELGITNYNPKIETGAIPIPMFIYAKSINPFFNAIFFILFKFINVLPNFHKRNIFNKRHFDRYNVTENIYCYYKEKEFLLKDVSINGLSIETDCYLKKPNHFELQIVFQDEFVFYIKVKIVNIIMISNNRYKIGLSIKKINNEYIMHFYHLVSYYESLNKH